MNRFPQRLKELRDIKGCPQYVLSHLCGLSGDMVRRYEAGEDEPRLSTLEIMADYFEVSMDYLVGRDNRGA